MPKRFPTFQNLRNRSVWVVMHAHPLNRKRIREGLSGTYNFELEKNLVRLDLFRLRHKWEYNHGLLINRVQSMKLYSSLCKAAKPIAGVFDSETGVYGIYSSVLSYKIRAGYRIIVYALIKTFVLCSLNRFK